MITHQPPCQVSPYEALHPPKVSASIIVTAHTPNEATWHRAVAATLSSLQPGAKRDGGRLGGRWGLGGEEEAMEDVPLTKVGGTGGISDYARWQEGQHVLLEERGCGMKGWFPAVLLGLV